MVESYFLALVLTAFFRSSRVVSHNLTKACFARTYEDESLLSLGCSNTANVIRYYFPTQALNFAFSASRQSCRTPSRVFMSTRFQAQGLQQLLLVLPARQLGSCVAGTSCSAATAVDVVMTPCDARCRGVRPLVLCAWFESAPCSRPDVEVTPCEVFPNTALDWSFRLRVHSSTYVRLRWPIDRSECTKDSASTLPEAASPNDSSGPSEILLC
jgi:hypothetical protein